MKTRLAAVIGSLVFALICLLAVVHFQQSKPLHSTSLPGQIGWPEFSPDGKTIALTSDTGVALWDVPTWRQTRLLPGDANKAYWEPDGKTLLTFSSHLVGLYHPGYYDEGFIRRWDVATGKATLNVRVPNAGELTAISKDLSLVIVQTFIRIHPQPQRSKQGQFISDVCSQSEIWNTRSGMKLHTLPAKWDYEPCFSPDKRFLVAIESGKLPRLHLYDMGIWQELPVSQGSMANASCARFSPDGKLLATGTEKAVTLWDTTTWRIIRTMPAHFKYLFRLSFSSDGTRLGAGGYIEKDKETDFCWTLWNPLTGEWIADNHHAYFWGFLSNSKFAYTSDTGCGLWDEGTGKEIWSSIDHVPDADKLSSRTCAAPSPDQKKLATVANYTTPIHTSQSSTDHQSSLLQLWNMPHP